MFNILVKLHAGTSLALAWRRLRSVLAVSSWRHEALLPAVIPLLPTGFTVGISLTTTRAVQIL